MQLPAAPTNQAEVDDLAARLLVALTLAVGALVLAAGALPEWLGTASALTRLRMAIGAGLLVSAGLAEARRRRQPRQGSLVVVLATALASWVNMFGSGAGVHGLVLGGVLFAIGLSGVLVNLRLALALSAGHVLMVLMAYQAERSGLIAGQAAMPTIGAIDRVVGQLVLTAVAMAAAVLLARLIQGGLSRAFEREEQLAELLSIGSDWTWEMNPRGLMTSLSSSFEARTGRTVAEFLRSGQPGGPQAEDDDEWRAVVALMQARQPVRDRIITMRCADGTPLVVMASASPRYDVQGRFIGWRGVSRNVTQERLAQQQQQRTRALLDRLVGMSPDAICVARLRDGVILLANPRFLRVAGRSEDEVLGRSALQLGLWRDEQVPLRLRDALHTDGEVHDLRVQVFPAGAAAERPMLLSAAAFDWDGVPVAVISTRDVAEIERARAVADAILEHASVGLALVRDWRIERANPLFEALFRHAAGSLVGQSIDVLFDQSEFSACRARVELLLTAHTEVDVECEARRGDGSALLVRLRARPVEPGRPLPHGSIWVAEDITARRRAERELADAKLQAEAASQAKSAFLATMSHEIRTPLNGVLGLARLVQDPQLDVSRRTQYLQHLQDAAELLSGIVSDVLDLSKIEAGHLQIETIGFDLHELLRRSFGTFEPLGRERGLAMRFKLAAEVPQRVLGDPVRVRQILANYLGNALKFTPRGEIRLAVRGGGAQPLRLEVHDTGPGVEAAVREQLFKPFAQGDSSTTRRYGGTGLGLSICRELAERMGGRVGVDSDGASGSCFWAELVLPPEPRAGQSGERAVPSERPLQGLQVLVAEDNAVNRLIVGVMLRQLGAEVHEAADGQQALQLAARLGPALQVVLMDLHMPVLDGLQAARALRERVGPSQLPIYALTAAVLDAERQAASEAGMNGFVAKPVLRDELLRVLLPWVPAGRKT